MTRVDPISLRLSLGGGRVNAYLLTGEHGRVLVDTGSSCSQSAMDKALESLLADGPALRLILLTHGDLDHAGNAAHLSEAYNVPIAMHRADAAMVERGDMRAGRQVRGCFLGPLGATFMGYTRGRRFTPDIHLEDRASLEEFGVEAAVLHLLGHSSGSLGVLTAEGDLLCGDLLDNRKRPMLSSLMDQESAARITLERLRRLDVRRVYPGHGAPFSLDEVPESGRPPRRAHRRRSKDG